MHLAQYPSGVSGPLAWDVVPACSQGARLGRCAGRCVGKLAWWLAGTTAHMRCPAHVLCRVAAPACSC